jgi:cytochrome c-type protein NapC
MRWWGALRQAYPNRRPVVLAVLVLVACVIVGGGIVVAASATIHATSTEQFCIGCHELRDNAYAEFKGTIHDKNRTGVRAQCADCHLPREFVPMMIRKVEAAREVWGHLTGYIDTKEKYEKNRHAMAVREWTRMKKNDSQECRNCHDLQSMDAAKQDEGVAERHAKARAAGTTCIDCHFGIAHNEPEGPGPKEIKVDR